MSLTKDKILNSHQIIKGIKLVKQKPKVPKEFIFNKNKPIGPHNYPMTRTTHWQIHGYKKDIAGIRRSYHITKDLPTGTELSPRLVGLDGFYSVRPTYQRGYSNEV